ncbi:FkbM family methyltransferase [Cognatishimia sp.]|uniref:FkbM family methyltransferase n=1 Tax=Cognatishimia sp. TaxID=2211648 RepID=UPI0035192149|nr:FkbM family methyltransferase [Cognatishimia sp.]
MKPFDLNGISIALPADMQDGPIAARLKEGRYERAEAQAARLLIQPGMRVVEIGAGLGYVSAICASKAGAENVVSFEANPRMVPVARKTLDLNGFHATPVEHAAIVGHAHEGEYVSFAAGKHFWGSSLASIAGPHGKRIEVPALRLQDVLTMVQPDVLIMDVEGAELGYMDTEWPTCLRAVVMERHPKKYGAEGKAAIRKAMIAAGFRRDPEASADTVTCFRR